MGKEKDTIRRKSWKDFRESGLLWFINIILHVFGWVICFEINADESVTVYPARTTFRGFDEKSNMKGYEKVTAYLYQNIIDLMDECGGYKEEEKERSRGEYEISDDALGDYEKG